MDKDRAYLCIGGPYDGRRYACKDTGFKVAHAIRMAHAPMEYDARISSATVEHVVYIADCFKSSDNKDGTWFWRPADQPLKRTIEMLLERYEQANNIVWQETPFGR